MQFNSLDSRDHGKQPWHWHLMYLLHRMMFSTEWHHLLEFINIPVSQLLLHGLLPIYYVNAKQLHTLQWSLMIVTTCFLPNITLLQGYHSFYLLSKKVMASLTENKIMNCSQHILLPITEMLHMTHSNKMRRPICNKTITWIYYPLSIHGLMTGNWHEPISPEDVMTV